MLDWKWENVMMYFLVGLPRTTSSQDAFWVIVDWLTMSTQFILMKVTCKLCQSADIYVKQVIRFHSVPKDIISNQETMR